MKIKILTIAVMLLCMSLEVQSQDNMGHSINLSVAPVGYTQAKISHDNEKFTYNYKSFLSANLSYEKYFENMDVTTEFYYQQAKFDNYKLNGSTDAFNPAQKEDIYNVGVTIFAGIATINKYKRFQVPFYLGPGCEYIYGGPFHNLTFNISARARMKFYMTNNIGIFADVTGRYGFGSKSGSRSSKYNLSTITVCADAGVCFGF